jgi:RNA polymerase sigma-70 factor (ECF subfamily)
MDAAKDIVQDFFIRFWEKRNSLQLHTGFEAYAYSAVKNRSLNFIASEDVKTRRQEEVRHNLYVAGASSETTQSDARERYRVQLIQAIEKLPEQRRKVFLLSNVGGLKYTEIAQQLNISVNTVKTQIRKAYLFLREECGALPVLLGGYFYLLERLQSPFFHIYLSLK